MKIREVASIVIFFFVALSWAAINLNNGADQDPTDVSPSEQVAMAQAG